MALNCGDDWSQYLENCDTFASGMSAAIFFKPGVEEADVLNTGLTAPDVNKIQALVFSGDAMLVSGIQMSIEPPSPVTAPSYIGCVPDTAVTYDRTMNIKDPKVNADNITFYNSIQASQRFVIGGVLIYECEADRTTLVIGNMYFNGGRVSPEGADRQRFEGTLTYRSPVDALVYPNNPDIWNVNPAS